MRTNLTPCQASFLEQSRLTIKLFSCIFYVFFFISTNMHSLLAGVADAEKKTSGSLLRVTASKLVFHFLVHLLLILIVETNSA